jgi:hypothetical protein
VRPFSLALFSELGGKLTEVLVVLWKRDIFA